MTIFLCENCGEPTERHVSNQRYCPICRPLLRRKGIPKQKTVESELTVVYDPHGLSLEGKKFTLHQAQRSAGNGVFVKGMMLKQNNQGYLVNDGQLVKVSPRGQGDILAKAAKGNQARAVGRKKARPPGTA